MSKVIFDGPNKLMVVASGIVELDAGIDVYSDWKEWSIQEDNSKYLQALRTVGGDPTVTGQYISPYYFIMNEWKIRPYEGNHHLVVTGNLYVDGGGNPFVPTLGNYNVLATQNVANIATATIQELEAIQYSSFQNGAWLDADNGAAGTDYPLGNSEFPVNNLADAKTITQERGFKKIYILGNYDFQATDDINNLKIKGQNEQHTTITVASGCSVSNTRFEDVYISGVLVDASGCCCHYCEIGNLIGARGTFWECILSGNITLGGDSSTLVMMLSCFLGTSAIGLIEIDMCGNGPALAMRAYTGGVRIKNKSGASKVAIDFISGRLEIKSTVTAGTFFVRGVGEITENLGTGITIYDASLTNPATVTNAVWDESQSEHASAGTFGSYLDSKVSEAGGGGLTTSGIADAVWDEILADHQGIGSTAEALEQAATASGLPAEITEQDKLDIADKIWDELAVDHTTSGTFGKKVVDIYGRVDIAQAEVNDPGATTTKFISTLTETMTGFWARGALIFTSGDNSGLIRGIKSYNGTTKEVQVQTPLSYTPVTGNGFSIIPARKFLTSDIEDIVDGIWDEPFNAHTTSGTFGKLMSDIQVSVDSITIKLPSGNLAEYGEYTTLLNNIETYVLRALGLTQENYYLDNTSYTEYQGAKLLTSGRLRIYSNSGSVGTGSDVIATYQITSVWTNDELDTYKVVKQ